MNRIIKADELEYQNFLQNENSFTSSTQVFNSTEHDDKGCVFPSEVMDAVIQQFPNKMLLSIKEAAGALGVSIAFIRKKIADAHINSISMGDRKMISINELARLIYYGV